MIKLKKCEVCKVRDIPPIDRKGRPITRQSKYNERKTCSDICFRRAHNTSGASAVKYSPPALDDPIDRWLCGKAI